MRRVMAGWFSVLLAATCVAAHAVPIAGAVSAASADQDVCKNGKDRVTAIQACTALISLSASDPAAATDAHIRRALLLGPTDGDQALTDLGEALKLSPNNLRALQVRALLYALRHNTDAAMADLNQAIAAAPADPESRIARASMRETLGDPAGALADFSEAIRLQPGNAQYYGLRGEAYLKLKNYDPAIVDLNQAVRLAPQSAKLAVLRGEVVYAMHDADGAIADFGRAIALDPKLFAPYLDRAIAEYRKRDFKAAIGDLNAGLALQPQQYNAVMLRGSAHQLLGELEPALADYSTVIALVLKPQDPAALRNRARLQLTRGRFADAVADADALAVAWPTDESVAALRCLTRAAAGTDLAGAATICGAVADATRTKPDFLVARALLRLREGRLQEAFADYNAADKAPDPSGEALYGRGVVERRLGRAADATADMAKGLALDAVAGKRFEAYGYGPAQAH